MSNPDSVSWSVRLTAEPVGLSLAREANWCLIWDRHSWVTLLDPNGQVQGRHHHSCAITTAALAEDARSFVIGDATGFTSFSPDMQPGKRISSFKPVFSLALDVSGEFCLCADVEGRLALWDRSGSLVREWESPRPAKYLGLVATEPHAIVAADFGFCGRLDLMRGEWLWRDRPVVHVGSVSLDGTGERVALACFSERIRLLNAQGEPTLPPTKMPGCRAASLSVDGRAVAIVDMEHQLSVVELRTGRRQTVSTNARVLSARLGGLAEVVWFVGADVVSAVPLRWE